MSSIELDIRSKKLRYEPPLEDKFPDRKSYLLTVNDHQHTGFGEAAPLNGWTESNSRCHEVLRQIDVENLEELEDLETELTDTPAARYAINEARLDYRARKEDKPLHELLGETASESELKVNGLIHVNQLRNSDFDSEHLLATYRVLKIKTDCPPQQTINVIENNLSHLNKKNRLRIDPNSCWNFEDTLQLSEDFKKLNLQYLEQPLDPDNLDDHERLSEVLPIALDESVQRYDSAKISRACQFVVLKPMVLGGLSKTSEMVSRFSDLNVRPVITSSLESIVGQTGTRHLAYAHRSKLGACGLGGSNSPKNDPAWSSFELNSDVLEVSNAPGIGISEAEIPGYQ